MCAWHLGALTVPEKRACGPGDDDCEETVCWPFWREAVGGRVAADAEVDDWHELWCAQSAWLAVVYLVLMGPFQIPGSDGASSETRVEVVSHPDLHVSDKPDLHCPRNRHQLACLHRGTGSPVTHRMNRLSASVWELYWTCMKIQSLAWFL
jgi:hypothetical protein